jgi:hypothetical protein
MKEPLEAAILPAHLTGYHRVRGQSADPWGTFKPSKTMKINSSAGIHQR